MQLDIQLAVFPQEPRVLQPQLMPIRFKLWDDDLGCDWTFAPLVLRNAAVGVCRAGGK